MRAVDDSDWEPQALRRRVIRGGVPLYGLAAPHLARGWLVSGSERSVRLEFEFDPPGREVEIAFVKQPRAWLADPRRRSHVRSELAVDLLLHIRYPREGGVHRGGDWWTQWSARVYAEADAISADSTLWQAETVIVDGRERLGWCTQVDDSWTGYFDRPGGQLVIRAISIAPRDLRIRTLTPDEFAGYVLRDPEPDEEDDRN